MWKSPGPKLWGSSVLTSQYPLTGNVTVTWPWRPWEPRVGLDSTGTREDLPFSDKAGDEVLVSVRGVCRRGFDSREGVLTDRCGVGGFVLEIRDFDESVSTGGLGPDGGMP